MVCRVVEVCTTQLFCVDHDAPGRARVYGTI
jgi:hypothetical protein